MKIKIGLETCETLSSVNCLSKSDKMKMFRWKCHLAHTDAEEVSQIRDERWTSVLVGTLLLSCGCEQ